MRGGLAGALVLLALGTAGPAAAATVDGHDLDDGRVPLHPRTVEVQVTVDQPAEVRVVQLRGTVLGLTFFRYDTAVVLEGPGSRRLPLDLSDLDGQATGLIPAELVLLDAERDVVDRQGFTADVRGSWTSVYGLFGLGVLALTLVTLVDLVLGHLRGRLPANRFRRLLRCLPAGAGIGLVVVVAGSALRVLVPSTAPSLVVVAVAAAALGAVGYLLPART